MLRDIVGPYTCHPCPCPVRLTRPHTPPHPNPTSPHHTPPQATRTRFKCQVVWLACHSPQSPRHLPALLNVWTRERCLSRQGTTSGNPSRFSKLGPFFLPDTSPCWVSAASVRGLIDVTHFVRNTGRSACPSARPKPKMCSLSTVRLSSVG